MKLIVGLGNYGRQYLYTRHNLGFMCLDSFALKNSLSFKESLKFKGLIAKMSYDGEDYIFFKPLTYMNNSGIAVALIMNYYKISIGDIIVIVDDLDLPLGQIRMRISGKDGGHNGLKSIISNIGDSFNRIRIGIKGENIIDSALFVLQQFNEEEKPIIKKSIETVMSLIDDFINKMPYDKLMTKYSK